jgi:hypothetical protein
MGHLLIAYPAIQSSTHKLIDLIQTNPSPLNAAQEIRALENDHLKQWKIHVTQEWKNRALRNLHGQS